MSFNIVSYSHDMEHHTMKYMSTIFIEIDGEYFYLYEDDDKINDIFKMPDYIKDDWVNYNKREIDICLLDRHIKELEEVGIKDSHEMAGKLKSIRRNLIINKVI